VGLLKPRIHQLEVESMARAREEKDFKPSRRTLKMMAKADEVWRRHQTRCDPQQSEQEQVISDRALWLLGPDAELTKKQR